MKQNFISIIFALCISLILAEYHPDHPGKCWHEYDNRAYSVGENLPLQYCALATCHYDTRFHIQMCDGLDFSYGCTIIPEDLTKPYPDCCAKSKCRPKIPGKCWDDNGNREYSVGENLVMQNSCVSAVCQSDSKFLIQMCDGLDFSDGCTIIPQDLTKPYPDCCAKSLCPS